MSKPGEKALMCLEEMKSRQVVPLFKTPKVTTTRNKQKTEILTEEQYVEEIGKIIQRDFFPVRSDVTRSSATLSNYLCTLPSHRTWRSCAPNTSTWRRWNATIRQNYASSTPSSRADGGQRIEVVSPLDLYSTHNYH